MPVLVPQGQSQLFFQGASRFFEATQIAVTDAAPVLIVPANDNTVVAVVKLASGNSVAIGDAAVTFADGFLLVNPGEELPIPLQLDIYAICDSGGAAVVCVWRQKASA